MGLLGITALAWAAGNRAVNHTGQEWADAACVTSGPGVTAGTGARGRQAETGFAISHHQPGGR